MGDSVKNIWGEMDEKAMSSMTGPKMRLRFVGILVGFYPSVVIRNPRI